MQPVSFEAKLSVLLLGKLHLASRAEYHFSMHDSRSESPFHDGQIVYIALKEHMIYRTAIIFPIIGTIE